jgi:rubrerythrin
VHFRLMCSIHYREQLQEGEKRLYSYNIHYGRAESNHLLGDITKAINGEYSAIACYEQLAKIAPNEEARNRILEIRKDEIRHYQIFSQIYFTITGRQQPAPQIVEQCATEYRSGLEAALKDEQETVDFYHEIAYTSKDHPYVSEQFRRAAADEQNHAVWFLYFYTKSTLLQP